MCSSPEEKLVAFAALEVISLIRLSSEIQGTVSYFLECR
jgi:hypothetical protein